MTEPPRNVKEAAAWLGISPKSLYNLTAARAVPFSKVGRHIRFTQEHLDAILADGEQPVAIVPTRLRVVGPRPPAGPRPKPTPRPKPQPKPQKQVTTQPGRRTA